MTDTSVIQKVALIAILGFLSSPASGAFSSTAPSADNNSYVAVVGEVSGAPVSFFHLDIYKIYPDSRRELVRTGRQPGNTFTAYLELGYSHTLHFQLDGHEQKRVDITAMELHQAREQKIELAVRMEKPSQALQQEPAAAPALAVAPPEAEPEQKPARKPQETKTREKQVPQQMINTSAAPSMDKAAMPQSEKEESVLPQKANPPSARVLTEEKIRGLIAGQIDEPFPGEQHIKLSRQVFLYREIEEKDKVLARLSPGAEVEVLERTTRKWWMVSHKGHIGWIETQLLQEL